MPIIKKREAQDETLSYYIEDFELGTSNTLEQNNTINFAAPAQVGPLNNGCVFKDSEGQLQTIEKVNRQLKSLHQNLMGLKKKPPIPTTFLSKSTSDKRTGYKNHLY